MKVYDTQGREVTSVVTEKLDFYDTGWIACAVWTDQQLGTVLGGSVIHNLNANLSDLMVKVIISSDGTDDAGMEIGTVDILRTDEVKDTGLTYYQTDSNTITIYTGQHGIEYINPSGVRALVATQSWYYKIKVYKMVTVPPAIINSRVRVTKDDAQSIADDTLTIMEYDDVEFDSLGEWNNTTWRFTAKNAGHYSVKVRMMWGGLAWAEGKVTYLSICKNGVTYSRPDWHEVEHGESMYLKLGGSDDVYLNGTTDYIDIRIYHDAGAPINTHNDSQDNYLSIHRLP